jgi:hypothetical protein
MIILNFIDVREEDNADFKSVKLRKQALIYPQILKNLKKTHNRLVELKVKRNPLFVGEFKIFL